MTLTKSAAHKIVLAVWCLTGLLTVSDLRLAWLEFVTVSWAEGGIVVDIGPRFNWAAVGILYGHLAVLLHSVHWYAWAWFEADRREQGSDR